VQSSVVSLQEPRYDQQLSRPCGGSHTVLLVPRPLGVALHSLRDLGVIRRERLDIAKIDARQDVLIEPISKVTAGLIKSHREQGAGRDLPVT